MTGPQLDRTTAVLSIRPAYVDRILDGSKTIEFRRKPLPIQVGRVLIWQTGYGGIRGLFEVAAVRTQAACFWTEIDRLLDAAVPEGVQKPLFVPGGGIDVDSLFAYAGGPLEPLTGISIRNARPTLSRQSLGLSAGPQSWRYAPADWCERLAAVL